MQVSMKTMKTNDFLITAHIRLNTVQITKNQKSIMTVDIFDENDLFEYKLLSECIYYKKIKKNDTLTIEDRSCNEIEISYAEQKIVECFINKLKKVIKK